MVSHWQSCVTWIEAGLLLSALANEVLNYMAWRWSVPRDEIKSERKEEKIKKNAFKQIFFTAQLL